MTIRIFNEEREYIGIMVANTFNDLSHISKVINIGNMPDAK